MPFQRTCPRCGCSFEARRSDKRFCSHRCYSLSLSAIPPDGPPWTIVQRGEWECWEWDRFRVARGYGRFGGAVVAHRWVYERFIGKVPDGLELDHLCRNTSCVNPAHLEPVTHAENMRRSVHQKVTPEMATYICSSSLDGVALARELGLNKKTVYKVRRRGC
jgi:hypothetical protein